MTLAAVLLLAAIAGWAFVEARTASHEPHEHLPRELATGLALLVIHVGGLVEHLVRGQPSALLSVGAGSALVVLGIALRIAAIRTLGPRFVSSCTIDRVITTGPYRWMKHPSEIGLLLTAAGGALLVESAVAAAIAALILLPLSVVRTRAEDRAIAAC